MQYKKISDFPNITTVGSGVYLPAVDPSESLAINQNKKIRVADFLDNYQGFKQSGTGAVSRTVTSKLRDVVSVKDFGAVGDGVANDSPAFIAALAFSQNVKVPKGLYKLDTSVTVPVNYTLETDYGVEFTGAGTIIRNGVVRDFSPGGLGPRRVFNEKQQYLYSSDSDVLNLFETCNFRVTAQGNFNAIVGAAVQTGPTAGFPCGITGYGKQNHSGNQAFGIFGRCDLREFGVATNELNTFNYKAGPPGVFPPNRSFGITNAVPVTLTIAAGGTYQSLIGVQICREGSEPQSYVCGIYTNPDGCTDYGVFVDATSTEGAVEAIHANFRGDQVNNYGLIIQYKNASPSASALFINCVDNTGASRFNVKPTGQIAFGTGLTASTVGVSGAAAVLPSNPTGYLTVEINGLQKKIPFYEP